MEASPKANSKTKGNLPNIVATGREEVLRGDCGDQHRFIGIRLLEKYSSGVQLMKNPSHGSCRLQAAEKGAENWRGKGFEMRVF